MNRCLPRRFGLWSVTAAAIGLVLCQFGFRAGWRTPRSIQNGEAIDGVAPFRRPTWFESDSSTEGRGPARSQRQRTTRPAMPIDCRPIQRASRLNRQRHRAVPCEREFDSHFRWTFGLRRIGRFQAAAGPGRKCNMGGRPPHWGIPIVDEWDGRASGAAYDFADNAVQVLHRLNVSDRRDQLYNTLGVFQRTIGD